MKEITQEILTLIGNDFVVSEIEEITGGYLASAYKVTAQHKETQDTKHFFLKSVKTKGGALANELPEDILHSYLVGARANVATATSCPKTYGCFISTDNSIVQKIDFGESSNIFELQDFRAGQQLLPALQEYMKKGNWNADIEECINGIALMLAQIHSIHPEYDSARAEQVYKRSVRDILCHPELTLSVFTNNLQDSEIFKGGFKYEYIANMLKLFDTCTDGSRLSLIHGDFWYSNIMLDENKVPFLIDYSRQGYGEPGIDVGWFYGSMMWQAVVEQNTLYQQVARYFIERYTLHSKDSEIEKYATVPLGFIGAIAGIEPFFPSVSDKHRREFIDYIHECIIVQKLK